MNIFSNNKTSFFNFGRIYLSIVPGEIVDSIINTAPFSQTSRTLFTAEITYFGSSFLLLLNKVLELQ